MAEARLKVIQTDDELEVILPMPLPYFPVPNWLGNTEIFVIVVFPIWIICAYLYRAVCGIQPPPRAHFQISRDRFYVKMVSRETGESSTLECDPMKIIELRKNQYVKGLWIHVHGVKMQNLLEDIDDATVSELADLLWRYVKENRSSENRITQQNESTFN